MNAVQMDSLARSLRGESFCGACGRPWFGSVAYCPYCGRKAGVTTINQVPRDQPRAAVEPRMPTPSKPRTTVSAFPFKAAVAGLAALLVLWMVVKLLVPMINKGAFPPALPRLPISVSEIASRLREHLPTLPAPGPADKPRTGTADPPASSRSLCSVANEKAGLCKSQD